MARYTTCLALFHDLADPGKQLEYWLSSLKVIAIIIFMILGIVVNCGGNTDHRYIGGENWRIPGAPFHNGIGGFASVFVTASFACKSFFRQPDRPDS